jgi:hypothetical protein
VICVAVRYRPNGTGTQAAIGGSLLVRMRRLPDDFPKLVARLRGADDVLCVLSVAARRGGRPPEWHDDD